MFCVHKGQYFEMFPDNRLLMPDIGFRVQAREVLWQIGGVGHARLWQDLGLCDLPALSEYAYRGERVAVAAVPRRHKAGCPTERSAAWVPGLAGPSATQQQHRACAPLHQGHGAGTGGPFL